MIFLPNSTARRWQRHPSPRSVGVALCVSVAARRPTHPPARPSRAGPPCHAFERDGSGCEGPKRDGGRGLCAALQTQHAQFAPLSPCPRSSQVQHAQVAPLIREDLLNGESTRWRGGKIGDGTFLTPLPDSPAYRMVAATAIMEPAYDLRPLIREFIKAVGSELDFHNEARTQMRAASAMQTFRSEHPEHDVVVPTLFDEVQGGRNEHGHAKLSPPLPHTPN